MKGVSIIGAGIGGLTTAIALKQKGFKVIIYEQSKKIKPVGAGIMLASNAMQVYDKLGLKETISRNGLPILSMNITKPSLNPLSKIDLTYFEHKFHTQNIAIHRGTLQDILLKQLSEDEIKLDYTLNTIDKNQDRYTLAFTNGEKIDCKIVIGADGIHSKVRESLFQNFELRHANQICWRGITDFNLPTIYKHELNEAWGNISRFGFVEIADNKVYWYALKTIKQNEKLNRNVDPNDFLHFNPIITELIQSTNQSQIHVATISDLKPMRKWFKDNVCLIGDAAHATTPNLGQGACQAIEDAYVIAECLDNFDANTAFAEFQKIRQSKVSRVVKTSWSVGKIAQVTNPLFEGVRNLLMKLIPASIGKKQNEKIYKLTEL